MFPKPDFDRQQLERSGGSFEKKEKRHEDDRDNRDREFKRPKFEDRNRERGGRRGGGRGRGGRVPDHIKNPEKYTKYSLKVGMITHTMHSGPEPVSKK